LTRRGAHTSSHAVVEPTDLPSDASASRSRISASASNNMRCSTQAGHFRLGLRAAWKATLNVKCPHCGEVHEISVRETYINGALKQFEDA
jgi:phage FluMu protein Com